jgi:hypothetical protein
MVGMSCQMIREEYSKSKAEPIEVEVLPPEGKAGDSARGLPAAGADALPGLIALLMDNLIKLPGTTRRLGLNPFIDLLPVFGDGAAAVISALTLLVAARYRVPKVVLARMSVNILLNAVIGIIPGVGEIFAFWFRPSSRNYALLQKHLSEHGEGKGASTRGDWWFVIALAGGVLVIFGGCIVLGAWLFYVLLHAIFGWGR